VISGDKNLEEMYLRLKRIFLDYEIANFYRYLEAMEESLRDRLRETSVEIQRAKAEIQELGESAEHRAELVELLAESSRVEGIVNLMRQSFFVSLYAFLELWLRRECRVEGRRRENVKLSLSDLRGRGIEQAKTYFTKVLESEFPFASEEWNKIKKYQWLRDCIVHRQGSLTGLSDYVIKSELKKFVEAENGLCLCGPGSQILIEHDFCVEALQTIRSFLALLLFP